MKTISRTILMQGSPPVGKMGSRHLALTSMLIICVHHELFSKELEILNKLAGKTFSIMLENRDDRYQKIVDKLFFKEDSVSNSNGIFKLDNEEYEVTEKDGEINFEAETISEGEGVRIWKGTIKDNKIEGVMVWARAGHSVESYNFEGEMI
jgi:hypothetical protein